MPSHQFYTINHKNQEKLEPNILIIYTGGTLGMVLEKKSKSLVPFSFDKIIEYLPDLERLAFSIDMVSILEPIDSSNVEPSFWIEIVTIIKNNYEQYDGFVIIHGTDTMAYTASALSFMLLNLSKPVILTGAQLPIGAIRTDATENLMTALEIAATSTNEGKPLINEVCIYFSSYLLRGNRAKKKESYQFYAFRSENYPALAEAGVGISFNLPYLSKTSEGKMLETIQKIDNHELTILKLFPGISSGVVSQILATQDLKGVILETFGAGNTPTFPWFLDMIENKIREGVIFLNVSQCDGGRVTQGHYKTSAFLEKIGVISGKDMTLEAAITKMMIGFSIFKNVEMVKSYLQENITGELTP